MVQIENLPVVLTGIGIIVSILYYASVLRNQNRTRQAQLYMQIWERFASEEGTRRAAETRSYNWTDFEDFEDKYGRENNIDAHAKRLHVWGEHNGVGFLVRKGLIDFELANQIAGGAAMIHWDKFGSIIREYRKDRNNPELYKDWEYFSEKVKQYRKDNV